jgi:hypothetical protein
LTSEIPYRRGKGFDITWLWEVWIIRDGRKSHIIYPNGKRRFHSFIHKIVSREVSPGSQIVVPERPEVKKLSGAEVVSIGSVMRVWLY